MKPLRVILCCSFALCCVSVAAAADRFEDIRQYIRSELVAQSVPSIAVAVAKDGKVVWEDGFGWADRERLIPATADTMYSLASISKPFTATGLMTLVQAGRIDLDKPINHYLGNAKLRSRVGEADQATVRQVANHTSGLPLHYQFFYADEPFQRPSMDETILRYGNLVTVPGEHYQYSNLGYGVLDYIMQRVSGTSYAQFMRREVFIPLGLTHTSVDIGSGLEAYAATRYGKDGLPLPFYEFDHPGASAVFSSAHDLVRFALFHLKAHLRDQKAILSDASIDEMHRATSSSPQYEYGIGFQIKEQNGYRFIAHSGSMGGVSTQMRLYPQERVAIVVLSNTSSQLSAEVADRIGARVLLKWIAEPKKSADAQQAAAQFIVPEGLRGTWRGVVSTYLRDLPIELNFLSGDEIHAKIGDQLTTLVNQPKFEDGLFEGTLLARIGTPDTERYGYTVRLSLRLRGDVLNGAAIAQDDKSSPRVRNALSQWVELKRKVQ